MQCDAGMVYLRSFIYDTEAGELEWVTQYDLDNLFRTEVSLMMCRMQEW